MASMESKCDHTDPTFEYAIFDYPGFEESASSIADKLIANVEAIKVGSQKIQQQKISIEKLCTGC